MEVTNSTIKDLGRTFSGVFARGMSQAPTFAEKIATVVPSTSSENVYGWMTKLPKLKEWIGARTINAVSAHDFTIKNKEFEGTVSVPRSAIEDDSFGIYNPIAEELGMQAAKHYDRLLATLILAGTSSLCYDKQNFFDTDHPNDATAATSGSQQNYWSSGKALSEANFDIIRSAMASFVGEDGESMNIVPNLLVVPPQLEVTAKKIVAATIISTGGTNVLYGMADVLVVPELASEPTAWYLLDVSRPIKPFVVQKRRPAQFRQLTETSEHTFVKNEYLWGTDLRGNVGYGPWFLAAKAVA